MEDVERNVMEAIRVIIETDDRVLVHIVMKLTNGSANPALVSFIARRMKGATNEPT